MNDTIRCLPCDCVAERCTITLSTLMAQGTGQLLDVPDLTFVLREGDQSAFLGYTLWLVAIFGPLKIAGEE